MRIGSAELARLIEDADRLEEFEEANRRAPISTPAKILDFLEVVTGDAFDVPPEQAINYFRAKGLRPSFSYADMLREAHDQAFTVAKMIDVDLLKKVRDSLDDALTQGQSFAEWKRGLEPLLQNSGWWGKQLVVDPLTGLPTSAQLGSPWRLETIFRTNMQTAYAAGQWQEIEAQADLAPFLMYDAIDDHRTRPLHKAWDRTVLPVSDPWWRTHFPPNGYNCRCSVIQMDQDEVRRLGLRPARNAPDDGDYTWENPRTGERFRVPKGIDPGFDRNPGRPGELAQLRQILDEKIEALPADMQAPARRGLRRSFDTSTRAGTWHAASFDTSPDWVRDVVLRQERVEVTQTPGRGAAAWGGTRVEMGSLDPSDLPAQATWRHEFGHILDSRFASRAYYRSSEPDFVAARQEDARELLTAAGRNRRARQRSAQRAAELERIYEDARETLIDTPKEARLDLLRRMAEDAGLDWEGFMQLLRQSTSIPAELGDLSEVGAAVRVARMIRAYQERDAERFLILATFKDTGDFRLIGRAWKNDGILRKFSDLIGATTNNQLASYKAGFFGHSEAYYRARRGAYDGQGAEAFANLTALAGHDNPLWWGIVRHLFPRQAELFEEIMRNAP